MTDTEYLLYSYNPQYAIQASNLIIFYMEQKNTTQEAMTNVARTMFLMYGLNPTDITASYGGTESKAVIDKNNGTVRICIAETRDKNLPHEEKAYGHDTFFHEILHALGFKWKFNRTVRYHGLGHSNNKEEIFFEKCRKILVDAVYDIEEKRKLLKQKYDDLLKNDSLFSELNEQDELLFKKYAKYRRRLTTTYTQAKKMHPLYAINYIHSLGLPLNAEYVKGTFDGKDSWVVKVYVDSNIKKYTPDMVDLYRDDIHREIDKQVKNIVNELKSIKKAEYPKSKMIDFLKSVRFELFEMRYLPLFIKDQDIQLKLPGL